MSLEKLSEFTFNNWAEGRDTATMLSVPKCLHRSTQISGNWAPGSYSGHPGAVPPSPRPAPSSPGPCRRGSAPWPAPRKLHGGVWAPPVPPVQPQGLWAGGSRREATCASPCPTAQRSRLLKRLCNRFPLCSASMRSHRGHVITLINATGNCSF